MNEKEFKNKAIKIHGDKYDYSEVKYKGSKNKVTITCNIHGNFEQVASEHLRGRGCEKCGRKKCDSEKFIEKAIQTHGNKYDYSNVDYKTSKEKVNIKCNKHGIFEQVAQNHINGQGCSICSGNITLTNDKFIEKAKKIHGYKYDYSLVNYVNSKTKIKIICKKHGIFNQNPTEHTSQKQGCPKCAGVGRTTIDFINDAQEKHENKYDYSKVTFKKYDEKISIICPIHGEFSQKPYIHLMGSGCQKCSESKGERKIASFLVKNNINFEKQKTFDNCLNLKTGRLLKFDFHIPERNMCIEYDGEYYYEPWRLYFDKNTANEKFNEMKIRDQIKTEYCKNNNILLLRIPYFELKNIDIIISNYLLKNKEN